MIKSGEKLEYFAQKISGKVVQSNAQEYGIIWRILAKTVRNFYLIFSRLHPVYTEINFAQKGGLLGQTKILCKMSRKSLTCANFRVIICRVIRAQFSRQNNGLLTAPKGSLYITLYLKNALKYATITDKNSYCFTLKLYLTLSCYK